MYPVAQSSLPPNSIPCQHAFAQTLCYRLIAHVALASASRNFLWLFSAAVSVVCDADEVRFDCHMDLSNRFVEAIVDVDVVDCVSSAAMVFWVSFSEVLI